MKLDELVPSESKYLKKEDVGETGVNMVITGFSRAKVGQGDDAEERAVIQFQGNVKDMVLNKTNAERLKHIFKTDDTDQIVGQTVNVFSDPMIEFGGKLVGGLRIRPATAQPAPAPAQPLEGNQQPTPPPEAYEEDPNDSIPF